VSTARAWVDSARPEPPEALRARVREVLEAHAEWDALPVAEALVCAGERLLADVMAKGEGESRDRVTALDLLAADACVTWAFEAASEDPESLTERAREATARILASRAPAASTTTSERPVNDR
jgi:hypothetical protein